MSTLQHNDPSPSHSAPDAIVNLFSHVKRDDAAFAGEGLRPFFVYRDLGIATATGGRVRAQAVRAARPSDGGTGLHFHGLDLHIVYVTQGWLKFNYDGQGETLVSAGDCVYQPPGIKHELFDWSPDMEFIEITSPADFQTTELPA